MPLTIRANDTRCQVCGKSIRRGMVSFLAVHVSCAIEYDTEISCPCSGCFFMVDGDCINSDRCDDYDKWWLEAVRIDKKIRYIRRLPGEK